MILKIIAVIHVFIVIYVACLTKKPVVTYLGDCDIPNSTYDPHRHVPHHWGIGYDKRLKKSYTYGNYTLLQDTPPGMKNGFYIYTVKNKQRNLELKIEGVDCKVSFSTFIYQRLHTKFHRNNCTGIKGVYIVPRLYIEDILVTPFRYVLNGLDAYSLNYSFYSKEGILFCVTFNIEKKVV